MTAKTPRLVRDWQVTAAELVDTVDGAGMWVSARDVAATHNVSPQSVSQLLGRLADQGMIESEVVTLHGTARTVEHTLRYRSRARPGEVRLTATDMPAWLAPRGIVAVGESRLIAGLAGFRRGGDSGIGEMRQSAKQVKPATQE